MRGNCNSESRTCAETHVAALPRFLDNWRQLTNDPQILQIVTRGVSIEFNEVPTQKTPPVTHVSQDEVSHIDQRNS